MDWISVILSLLAGFGLGLLSALGWRVMQAKTAKELAEELFRESEGQRQAAIDAVIDNLKRTFGSLSLDALSRSTEEFLKLAKTRLESERLVHTKELEEKKALIDQRLHHMTAELEKVSQLMNDLEKDRGQKFGELAAQLKIVNEQTAALTQTTSTLREALSSAKARGQWGERMAEDVLRLAGFLENINYLKQKAIEATGSRPDFTFLLPRQLKLHMDVKFPLDNYLKYLEAGTDVERVKCRADFLRDVKARIKEVTTREYLNPEQDTVDSVLLFIPNEQIYTFIHEQDRSIFDDGLRQKVLFCSPMTLLAILAVIRKAVDSFVLEQTSNEMLSLFGSFKRQWDEFIGKLELVGKRLGDAQREYDALITTRRRQLEKPLTKIDLLRTERGLPPAEENNGDVGTATDSLVEHDAKN